MYHTYIHSKSTPRQREVFKQDIAVVSSNLRRSCNCKPKQAGSGWQLNEYANTTSFLVTAVTENFVISVIDLIVTTKLVVMLQPSWSQQLSSVSYSSQQDMCTSCQLFPYLLNVFYFRALIENISKNNL